MLHSRFAVSDVSITLKGAESTIEISGTIKNGDEEHFKEYIFKFGNPEMITLNSKGGSVSTAISIGRQIRQLNDHLVVPIIMVKKGDECSSSCVFILAGGAIRIVYGSVGVHRPFLPEDSNFSMEEQKIYYQSVEKMIKEYFEEVNIPVLLYDDMFRIPVNKVRYLTEKEMQNYNLNENDPFIEEARNAKAAAYHKMTKPMYLKFSEEVVNKCRIHYAKDNPEKMKKFYDCEKEIKKTYE